MECPPECQAGCCGEIPFFEEEWRNYEPSKQVEPVRVVSTILRGARAVLAFTDDGKCVFLNRETWRCAVYEVRPVICRRFGQIPQLLCPYFDMLGRPRSKRDQERVKKHMDERTDKQLNRLKRM